VGAGVGAEPHRCLTPSLVAGLDPAIHGIDDKPSAVPVDARHKAGHERLD